MIGTVISRRACRIALALCSAAPAAMAQDAPASARASLRAADSTLAREVRTNGPLALVRRLASGGPILFPDAPILSDSIALRTALAAHYPDGTQLTLHPQHVVLSATGRFGCTVGLTLVRSPSDPAEQQRPGRYITCWRRLADGRWQPIAHSRNGEVPASAPFQPTLHGPATDARSSRIRSAAEQLRGALDADIAFARFAADSGPARAFGRWAAPDAMVLGSLPEPRRGPIAISEGLATFPASGRFSWAPLRTYGAAEGGLAFTVGEAILVIDATPRHTKYLTVWRQEADGSWRYIFDLGSDRP